MPNATVVSGLIEGYSRFICEMMQGKIVIAINTIVPPLTVFSIVKVSVFFMPTDT